MFTQIEYKTFKIYAYYRSFLSSLLLLMFTAEIGRKIFGSHQPELFAYTALIYTILNYITLIVLWWGKFNPRQESIFALLVIDIIALLLLMQSSGGIGSGLGYLLLICVATGAMFLSLQVNAALAGLTSILVIVITLTNTLTGQSDSRALFSAGSLGFLLFLIALGFSYLTQRIRISTQEAEAQKQHAKQLEHLAKSVVERMRTGVMVVNREGQINVANQAAHKLLSLNSHPSIQSIPTIYKAFTSWMLRPDAKNTNITISHRGQDVRLGFAELDEEHSELMIIFTEDMRTINQEAQQLKLASLGRLTASIAHEIRNPLASISHAGQLLAESPDLHGTDKRMTEIIETNSRRVNQIIENILQLSRRHNAKATSIHLKTWLESFTNDFILEQQLAADAITLTNLTPDAITKFDTSHLHQILTNLCNNGLRYSKQETGKAHIQLEFGTSPRTELPFIRVVDFGKGIADDNLSHLFEPFFTTEASGSGLGLYISKELCQANQATLSYKRTEEGLSCFQITLAHPQQIV